MKPISFPALICLGLINATGMAGPLKEALINRTQRDVKITEIDGSATNAQEGKTVRGTQGVRTGAQSAAELLFPDRTLARLGSDTLFTFESGTRKMNLESGTLLFQIPKGVGGASIRTGAITAAITGTTGFIERSATHYKLVLLEGTLRVFLNDRLRESMLVTGGQMLIGPIKSSTLKDWQTVPVDTERLMKTSKLLNRDKFSALSEEAGKKIERVIMDQRLQVQNGGLRPTNLVIDGYGTTLLAVDNATASVQEKMGFDKSSQTPTPKPSVKPTPDATPASTPISGPTPPPPATPRPTPISGDNVADYPAVDDAATGNLLPYLGNRQHRKPSVITQPSTFTVSDNNSTVFNLRKTTPTISITGNTNDDNDRKMDTSTANGTIYGGAKADGPAGDFLFNITNTFDAQTSFNSRFGSNYDTDFPDDGIAVFSFKKLTISGIPKVLSNGVARDVALLSNNGINVGNDSKTIALDGFTSLTLAATNGDIKIENEGVVAVSNPAFKFLHLYNRSGNVKIEGALNLAKGNLYIDTAKDLSLATSGSLIFNKGLFTSLGKINFEGNVQAGYLQIDARGTLDLKGTLQTGEFFARSDSYLSVSNAVNAAPKVTETAGGLVDLEAGETLTVSSSIQATSAADANIVGAGSRITLRGKRLSGTAISITSTAQLKALLDLASTGPGANVTLTSPGGDIVINGNIVAEKGAINVQNSGNTGLISLNGATLSADVIKVGALGANGSLNINGGTIAADSLLKLYAGGSNGTIRFQDNVTLNGNSQKIISANTVIIDNQKVVTVNGPAPASVHTNNAHFTGSGGDATTTGTFGGQGAVSTPLNQSPGF